MSSYFLPFSQISLTVGLFIYITSLGLCVKILSKIAAYYIYYYVLFICIIIFNITFSNVFIFNIHYMYF